MDTFPNGIDVKDVRVYDLTKEPEYGIIELLERDELEDYKGKYYALWFTKSGKSYRGSRLDTEKNTERRIKSWLANDRPGINFSLYNGIHIPYSQISHAIPLPTGDT